MSRSRLSGKTRRSRSGEVEIVGQLHKRVGVGNDDGSDPSLRDRLKLLAHAFGCPKDRRAEQRPDSSRAIAAIAMTISATPTAARPRTAADKPAAPSTENPITTHRI